MLSLKQQQKYIWFKSVTWSPSTWRRIFVAKEAGVSRIKTSMLPSSFFVDVFRNNEDLANGYIAFSVNSLASMKKPIS